MKKFLLALIVMVTANSTIAQTIIGNATLPNTKEYKSKTLVLNGAGIREKFWFDLYAAGLYLQRENTNAKAIVSQDKPTSIDMTILSAILSKKKMISAIRAGFENTNGENELREIQTKINNFISFLSEEITVGDKFEMIYLPSTGTELYKNSKLLGTIQGLNFKQALFNIWLAENPVDKDLKRSLLGN